MSAVTWFGLALLLIEPRRLRLGLRPRRARGAEDQVMELSRLLAVCLSGGLPLLPALEAVSREMASPIKEDVEGLLRQARRDGVARALLEEQGPLSALSGQLARAHVSGAPMREAVSAFVERRRSDARYRSLERARTLGVKLILPVSLLLLPGFIALVIGPTVVAQLDGLLGVGP